MNLIYFPGIRTMIAHNYHRQADYVVAIHLLITCLCWQKSLVMKNFSVDNGPWKSSLNVEFLDYEGTLIIQIAKPRYFNYKATHIVQTYIPYTS